MKPVSKYLLGGLCLLFAVVLFLITKKPSADSTEKQTQEHPSRPARPARSTTKVAEESPVAETVAYPDIIQILDMGPEDWERKFQTEYMHVDQEYKGEVVLLAGELQDSIKAGADKQGEESGAYAESILLLLKETKDSGK